MGAPIIVFSPRNSSYYIDRLVWEQITGKPHPEDSEERRLCEAYEMAFDMLGQVKVKIVPS